MHDIDIASEPAEAGWRATIDLSGTGTGTGIDADTKCALATARTLQRSAGRVAYGLHEAAQRVAEIYEQRLEMHPHAADADLCNAQANYWRSASEWAFRVAHDWDSGPPSLAVDPDSSNQPTADAPSLFELVTRHAAQVRGAATRLVDTVVSALFGVGLELQAVIPVEAEPVITARLTKAVEDIDQCIRQIRGVILDLEE